MKIRTLQRILALAAALAIAFPAAAQSLLSGRVVDGEDGTPLVGAVVTNTRTGDVAISGNDGSFRVRSAKGEGSLTVTYLGYSDNTMEVDVAKGANVGEIAMKRDAIGIADIVVMAGIVTSDRQTPVAVSNVSRAQIDMKLSNQEFPELLKATPSVYATKDSGGFGDSRISIRGFGSENVGTLINGVPVNGMENGKVYWSNWSGLADVTSFKQVQRGLGASKLALSSVGGTINVITYSTDAKSGGSLFYGIGNDGFSKLSVKVSSGMLPGGWAFTLAGGRQSGDGYVRGTNYLAWNYFVNISKVFAGGRHRLSFTAFGAPQWHNQRGNSYLIETYRTHPDGRRMNLSWGYKDGKIAGVGYGYNEYHKPQISLVHNWDIDKNQKLATSLYASIARGGGRRMFAENGKTSNFYKIDNNVTGAYQGSYTIKDDAGKDQEINVPQTPEGHIDWDAAYAVNQSQPNGAAKVVMGNAANSHNWYGVLSTYTNQITHDVKITTGFDGRWYDAFHGSKITDLLGAKYYLDNSVKTHDAGKQLGVGDIIQYDETGQILWTGLFAQAEYTKNNFSAFLSGSLSANFYRWLNPGAPFVSKDKNDPLNDQTKSKWVTFLPWSVKAGANYKVARNHSFFANGGYFTRAPFFNTAFVDYTIRTNPKAKVERIATVEAGYQFSNNVLSLTFNGYYTLWLDKGMTRKYQGGETINITGLNAQHMGLELEATYRPSPKLTLRAMGSLGDWVWMQDVDATEYNEQQQAVGATHKLYIAGVHVGNAAQATAALGVDWSPLKGLRIGADANWFGKNYADFKPENRTTATDKGKDAWLMPNYATVDLSLSYGFKLGDKISARLYGNVNNLLDTWYIADARDGLNHDAKTALVYYGFGRTWTAGIRFNF